MRFVQIRDFDGDNHVTYIEDSPKWRKCVKSDVLIARYGASLGRILRGLEGAYNVALVKVVPKGVSLEYLYYVLKSDFFQDKLKGLGDRSAQAGFNKEDLSVIPVPVPSSDEQRTIAQVLGALDDKIELNRRMNATLEAMAQAVFKEWFVDGAKEEWDETTVGGEFDIVMGQSPPGDTYNEAGEGVPFFQGRTDFGFRFPTPRVYCSAPTRMAKQGDTLVSVRAPVGSVNMAEHDCAIGRGVAAIRHKSGARSYTYHRMHSLKPQFELFEAGGTVFGSMNKKDFHGIKIQQPSPDRIDAFEKLVGAFDDRVTNNEAETRTITALRDTLLPKLMRGEVRVKQHQMQ